MFYNVCKNIISNIEKHPIISFDIFDTLITRNFFSPSDIFKIMENIINKNGININNFSKLRKFSEKELRDKLKESTCEEITLSDIYSFIQKKTMLSNKHIKYLYNLEINTEINNIRRCDIGFYLFNIAKKMNKKIILVSDMYLEKNIIKYILDKNKINGYSYIYISSEYKLTKNTGHLFEYILNDLNIQAEQILHIGDNPIGDQLIPNKFNINTFLIKKRIDLLENNYTFSKCICKEYKNSLTLSKSFILKMISDGIFNNCINTKDKVFDDNPFNFGYNILGPLIVGFSFWIKNNIEKNNINKIIFLSRDGFVFKKVFDTLFGDIIHTSYIRSSRMIARCCSFNNEWDLEVELAKPVYSQDLHYYLKYRFCLDDDDLKDIKNIKIGTKFSKEKLRDIVFFKKECIFKNSKIQQQLYKEYLMKYINNNDKVCVIDIGYAGTMQKCISNLLEKNIYGFYLSTDASFFNNNIDINYVESYIDHFFNGNKYESLYGINKFRFIYETLICSSENSFYKFIKINDKILEKFSSYNDLFRKNFVLLCHNGIIDFSKDFKKYWPKNLKFYLSGKDASFIIDSFIMNPTPNDINLFYEIEFEDGQTPDKKRVLISEYDNNSVEQLWKNAILLKNKQKKENVLKIINNSNCNNRIEKTGVYKKIIKFESIIVHLVCDNKKFNKYKKDRNRFFYDSKNKLLKLYYNIFNNV